MLRCQEINNIQNKYSNSAISLYSDLESLFYIYLTTQYLHIRNIGVTHTHTQRHRNSARIS